MTYEQVTGAFAGVGNSDAVFARAVDVSLSGTFTATVEVQRYIGGAWRTWETVTAGEYVKAVSARRCPIRLSCTDYTSGTANYALVAGDDYD